MLARGPKRPDRSIARLGWSACRCSSRAP